MDGKSFKKQLLNKRNKIGFKFVFMEYWGEANEKTVDKTCRSSYDPYVSVSSTPFILSIWNVFFWSV